MTGNLRQIPVLFGLQYKASVGHEQHTELYSEQHVVKLNTMLNYFTYSNLKLAETKL
jgi:hypothetical protein